jgi:hypothetical protein
MVWIYNMSKYLLLQRPRPHSSPPLVAASTSWASRMARMLLKVSLQLLGRISASLRLLRALVGPNGSTARQGGLAGAATHHWDPLQGLPARTPALLGTLNSV